MNRLRLPLAAAILCTLAAGCSAGSGRFPVYPVRGGVFVGGKPAAGAKVFFHPAADPSAPAALRPFATVEADGSFRLTTYLSYDGAPAGDYAVTVQWDAAPTGGGGGGGADDDHGGDRLRGAYSSPKAAKLKATVKPEPTALDPFQLK